MIKIPLELNASAVCNARREEILAYLNTIEPCDPHLKDWSFSTIKTDAWTLETWGGSYRVSTVDPHHEMLLALKYGIK